VNQQWQNTTVHKWPTPSIAPCFSERCCRSYHCAWCLPGDGVVEMRLWQTLSDFTAARLFWQRLLWKLLVVRMHTTIYHPVRPLLIHSCFPCVSFAFPLGVLFSMTYPIVTSFRDSMSRCTSGLPPVLTWYKEQKGSGLSNAKKEGMKRSDERGVW